MRFGSLSILAVLLISGCAHRSAAPIAHSPTTLPATRPVDPSLLSLEQIEPIPVLPPPRPSTRPAQPPLDAIQLYAQGRAALVQGDRSRAISLYESAIQKDPESYMLHEALANAYLGSSNTNDQALKELERAAQIEPDHIEAQFHLGRQYLVKGKLDDAVLHLRLALATSQYAERPDYAALTNFFLARALQQKGFDLAALEKYRVLLLRMESGLSMRGNQELFYYLSRPELVYLQVGELAEKHGDFVLALQAYRRASEYEPSNFQYSAHIVHALLGLKQFDDARALAAELVSGNRASPASMDLLREVYRAQGKEDQIVAELQRIHAARPGDRAITFALSDILIASDQNEAAEKILLNALHAGDADPIVASRLFDFYISKNQTPKAARLVIESLARRPDALEQFEPLFAKLGQGILRNRLVLPALQALEVDPSALASKSYWIARLAEALDRQALARSSLERAVAFEPPFPPAYRSLISDMLDRADWSQAQKNQEAEKLIVRAASQNAASLAKELDGLRALRFDDHARAVSSLLEAIRLGAQSPDTHYALAMAYFAAGRRSDGEQTLWKLASDYPFYDNAYLTLFRRYLNQGGEDGAGQAIRVLQTWLSSDPFSINARLLQVTVFMQTGRTDGAEQALSGLFSDAPENPAVVEELVRFYMPSGRQAELYRKLEDQISSHPENRTAAAALVRVYSANRRISDAQRVLDGLRQAVGNDPEELYFVAHLYEVVNQRDTTEAVLQNVLQLDPRHAPAGNDLGYMWADDGKNLDQAEHLIRGAVDVEPDNAAYLDSLGWVLYKRGKFEEAKKFLEQATSGGDRPDPVVLDHLGDALYRLNQTGEALKVWHRSLDRLSETQSDREDLRKLRLTLKAKIEQQEAGKPVQVAPLAMVK